MRLFDHFKREPKKQPERSLKEELQERYTTVEEVPFRGSPQALQKAMETFIEKNGGALVFNPDGGITVVSPTGSKATVYPGNS